MPSKNYSLTKTWKVWYNMIDRCTNEKCKDYCYYGARGINVCDRWLVYDNFVNDMGEAPKGKSLDRINSDGNYEPFNCRWATKTEQNQNRSYNIKGFTWNKNHKKYEAKIKKDGKKMVLGYFDTADEARNAYLASKSLLYSRDYLPEIARRLHSIWEAI